MLGDRILATCAVAGALAVPLAHGQTLLWSARYDSGGNDQLGAGRPFRVEGSGAVTLAGLAASDFFLARYHPDGAFDRVRVQNAAPALLGPLVVLDAEGRALWAGTSPTAFYSALVVRLSLDSPPETLFEAVPSPLSQVGIDVVEVAGDEAILVGYHHYGRFLSNSATVKKLGVPGWTATESSVGSPLVVLGIVPDGSGGAVVTVDPTPQPLKRIDSTGAVVWTRAPGDANWPWQTTPSLISIDATENTYAAAVNAAGDFATARLDPAGVIVWQRTFDGAGHGADAPTGLVLDVGGSLYVTGSSIGATGSSDFATVKYDAAGNLFWTRTYDSGGDDVPVGVAVDGAGNAWVTGTSGDDVVTLKYDPSGTQVFSHRFASPGPATVAGMAVDGWGNATVAFSAHGDVFVLRYGQAPVETGPLSFRTVDPCRAFDSREATLGGPSPLAGPSDHVIALAGVCGVPASAKAVSLNVTAVGATQPGSLALFPADQTPSATSAINYAAGQTRANNATVGLGTNAGLGLRVSQGGGSVHVLVDVVGYWE